MKKTFLRGLVILILAAGGALNIGAKYYKKHHLCFTTKNITEFRIFYSLGDAADSVAPARHVFAVEGDRQQLDSLGLDTTLNRMFTELEIAKLEKVSTTAWMQIMSNTSENISLRWKYKDDPEFYRFDMVIKDPATKNSGLLDYVLVSAGPDLNNQVTYFVKKENVPAIAGAMMSLAHRNWGRLYAANP